MEAAVSKATYEARYVATYFELHGAMMGMPLLTINSAIFHSWYVDR
jgi:hypothetical protein